MANITVTQGTQTAVRTETIGTTEVQVIRLDMGTSSSAVPFQGTILDVTNIANLAKGTITKLEGGTLGEITSVANVAKGTITKIEGGTVGEIASVTNIVNLAKGTITKLEGGTIGEVTSVTNITNLAKGTITKVEGGTVAEVTQLNGGSIRITVGTINVGTVVNNGGTVAEITNGTIRVTAGTVTEVTNLVGGTVTRLAQGSINVTAGTMNAGTINTGTINAGTINTGTINSGTFRLNPIPTQVTLSYGTTTTGTVGTLVAAPSAGSAIFITACDVNVQSGTAEPLISFNLVTNGQGVIARGNFAAGGGVAKTFPIPNSANNTGTALTFNILSGSGTVSYNVTYFVAVP